MARITDALLNDGIANGVTKAFGRGHPQPMLDLTNGGQFGWAPRLDQWVSNQAYVRRNLVCILLESPRFFTLMPEPEKWTACLKSLLELHCRSIEGYNAGLTVELADHPVGGAGEIQQEVVDVKRERSAPVFTFTEKYGMPIWHFLYNWITYGMMDPDTKYAMVGTLSGTRPSDMLADWFTASVLVFEPDPTHRKIVKSWVTTNMMPQKTGDFIGKRDLTSASELLEISVEFTAISQTGIGTDMFAQKILDSINIANANPYMRPAFPLSFYPNTGGISPEAAAATEGYEKGAEDLGTSAVTGVGNFVGGNTSTTTSSPVSTGPATAGATTTKA